MIVKGIKNVANINKLPLNTIYTNICVHFGFQLITVTAILYSHMAETLFIVKKKTTTKQPPPKKKKSMPIWSTSWYDLIIALKNSQKQSSLFVVSGFTSSATFYNTTTVTLRCDHLDFNFSNNTPMAIKEQAIKERGGNIHGSCLKNNSCTSDCKCMHD